jgi:uncharacterized membrane protein
MYQQTIPLIIMLAAILAGILLNNKNASEMKAELKADFQREISRLDAKIDSVSLSLHARLNVIDSDLREFYHLNGKHEGRLDSIEKRLG